MKISFSLFCMIFLLVSSLDVLAKRAEYTLELKDHLFFPSIIEIPANKKIKFTIYNRDATPEEFDSFDLNREKVIFPHKKAVIFIGPLPEGRYQFFGEYNPNTAKGTVVVTSKSQPIKVDKKMKTQDKGDS